MLADTPRGRLTIGSKHHMRLDAQGTFGKTAVTGVAECYGVMATIALLRIVQRLDRVNGNKITTMTLGFVITPEVFLRKIITGTAALVAIKTPLLLMALAAVVAGIAG